MSRMYALRVLYLAFAVLLLTAHASATAASPIRQLTTSTATNVRPAWSPDGKSIAFQSNRDGPYHIFVMNSDGSDVRQLTFNGADDSWPRWSPNGTWIALHSNVDANYEIYVIRPDGTDLTRVTDNSPVLDQYPEWSPNGKQLAIRRDLDLYLIDLDGSNLIQLTAQAALHQMASWSPDGKQIAFMSTREGYPSVFVINWTRV